MAPFGSENRRPVLCTTKVYLQEPPKTMGADNRHFNATFQKDGIAFRAVAARGNGSNRWLPTEAGRLILLFTSSSTPSPEGARWSFTFKIGDLQKRSAVTGFDPVTVLCYVPGYHCENQNP